MPKYYLLLGRNIALVGTDWHMMDSWHGGW